MGRNLRNQLLRKIHAEARRLGLDDDSYRDMLEQVVGVRSAKDLSNEQLVLVVERLAEIAGKSQPPQDYPGRPTNMPEKPWLKKVEALLAEAGRPWSYADAIATRMYGVRLAQWCPDAQGRGIIAALVKDAERHGRRTK